MNSEQGSLESLAEAGERLCSPRINTKVGGRTDRERGGGARGGVWSAVPSV